LIAAIGRELAEEDQTEVPGTPLIDPETPRLEDEEMDPLAGLRSSIRRQSPKKMKQSKECYIKCIHNYYQTTSECGGQ